MPRFDRDGYDKREMKIHPPCPGCGGPVTQRKHEGVPTWLDRINCSSKCAHAEQRRFFAERREQAIRDHAPCANQRCRQACRPRRGETLEQFKNRLFCSLPCYQTRNGPAHPAEPVPKSRPQTIEEFLAAGGRITRVPPAYVAASQQGALPPDIAARRIAQMKLPETKPLSSIWFFQPPARRAPR